MPVKIAADKLAIWAFAQILNPQSPHAREYPLADTSATVLQDGTWALQQDAPEQVRRARPFSTYQEIFQHGGKVRDDLKCDIQNAEKFIARLKAANDLKNPFWSWMAQDFGELARNATRLLVELAEFYKPTALENLWFTAHAVTNELEKLSLQPDLLPTLRGIAQKQSAWPVLYSPHGEQRRKAEAQMKLLGVGQNSPSKVIAAKWKFGQGDKREGKSGQIARRIFWALWEIHVDGNLHQCVCRNRVWPSATPEERESCAKQFGAEAAKCLIVRSPDADSPQLWENRLVAQGWPRWIVRLHQLPEITKANADEWFEIGWEALKEATGGDTTQNPELAALGESNAKWGRDMATTARGKTGEQKGRAESQIKQVLRTAFLRRFGNPAPLRTQRPS